MQKDDRFYKGGGCLWHRNSCKVTDLLMSEAWPLLLGELEICWLLSVAFSFEKEKSKETFQELQIFLLCWEKTLFLAGRKEKHWSSQKQEMETEVVV